MRFDGLPVGEQGLMTEQLTDEQLVEKWLLDPKNRKIYDDARAELLPKWRSFGCFGAKRICPRGRHWQGNWGDNCGTLSSANDRDGG
jgi:hypothetical protein